MKTLIAFFAGALLTSCLCNECKAQNVPTVTTFVNQYGQPVATVQQIGTTTFVSNQYGQLVSSGRTFNEAIAIPAQPIVIQNVLPTVPTLPMLGAPR
jgi:hypothetical protein